MHLWSPPGHRHGRSTVEVHDEFCEARWPRTPRLAYRAERRRAPISERPAAVSRDQRVFPHCCNSEETTMIVAEEPTGARVCGGVDWAKDDNAVCIVGAQGEALQRFMVTHDRSGLKDLVG